MNFLQLAQALRAEAGLSGTGPASVSGQSGESLRVVNWIIRAWTDIQRMRQWDFLQSDFSFSTIASTQAYPPADAPVSITSLRNWVDDSLRIYKTSEGRSTEQYLVEQPYDWFRDVYMFGSMATETGKPSQYAVRPNDKALLLGLIPDDTYTVTGRYWRSAQQFSGNTDEPTGLAEEYHMIIVHRALIKYAAFDAAPESLAHARMEFADMLNGMVRDYLPRMTSGDPLA